MTFVAGSVLYIILMVIGIYRGRPATDDRRQHRRRRQEQGAILDRRVAAEDSDAETARG